MWWLCMLAELIAIPALWVAELILKWYKWSVDNWNWCVMAACIVVALWSTATMIKWWFVL